MLPFKKRNLEIEKKLKEYIADRTYVLSSSLRGLLGLAGTWARDICLDDEELYGFSSLLEFLSKEASAIEYSLWSEKYCYIQYDFDKASYLDSKDNEDDNAVNTD